jgi:hypothetical protein
MAIKSPPRIFDGFSTLAPGVDGGRLPDLLEEDRIAEGENIIFREGYPFNRPPFLDVDLTFTLPNLTYNADGSFKSVDEVVGQSRAAFQDGIFQEASYYNPGPAREYIMASVGGRLYRFSPVSGDQAANVFEVQLERRNRSTIPINYHVQAGVYFIVQDGEASPIIYDGLSARRAVVDEIFTGLMMGCGLGRIVLIGLRGEIFFGDLRDSKGGGDADMLGMTETQFINEGAPSALPPGMGFPTAVRFLPTQDTATGVGDCLVLGQRGVESFFLSISRDQWKDSQFQKTALLEDGNAGHRSIAMLNQDFWFRDPKAGWRTYRQARAQAGEWTQIPMSTEVRKWIESDTPSLLNLCSAIAFNDRLIVTTNPYPNGVRPYHNGLLSLDLDVLSSGGKTTNPAWDGHWSNRLADPMTGLKVTQLVKGTFAGKERAFMFYLDANGKNALREIMPLPVGGDTGGPITSNIISRSMNFKTPYNEKRLHGADAWISDVAEPVSMTATYRPDQLPDFSPWQTVNFNAVGDPAAQDPGFVPTIRPGFSPRRSFKKPPDIGDPLNTKRIVRRGYEYQVKLQWTGRARLRRFRLHAIDETENTKATIPAVP